MLIHFATNGTPEADAAAMRLRTRYGDHELESADVIVALGGDGLMLQTLHRVLALDKPVYGLNFGSVGFLMNAFSEGDLENRVAGAQRTRIYPWPWTLSTHPATGTRRWPSMKCPFSGRPTRRPSCRSLWTTPSVSTNWCATASCWPLRPTPPHITCPRTDQFSPSRPPLLALTPISPFRPRRWRGAILSNRAVVKFTAREASKRPVSAVADNREITNVLEVTVREDRSHGVTLLFDPGTSLEERVLAEQFSY